MSVQVMEETIDKVSTQLFAVVRVKESNGDTWKDSVDIVSISSTGAGFYIDRECQAGRLVAMVIPLEPNLRCYDQEKELYAVFGLVQHCHKVKSEGANRYHVGVAFIGKRTPESYREDPAQSYRICGMNENGLWKIIEAGKEFKPRRDPRFYKSINHYLAVIDAKKTAVAGERATTENISKSGAAVLTTLDVHVGDRVKFISEEYDFSGVAVVCNRKSSPDGRSRVHLQFVENTFPVEKINRPESTEFHEANFDD